MSVTARKQAGQSVVEFAILLPIILLLIMGALDLGRAFFMKIALTNAAREGAYYLSYNQADKTTCTVYPTLCYDKTRQAVIAEAYAAGLTVQPANIAIASCCTSGQPVQVSASAPIQLTIFRFLFGNLTLTGRARMMVQ